MTRWVWGAGGQERGRDPYLEPLDKGQVDAGSLQPKDSN